MKRAELEECVKSILGTSFKQMSINDYGGIYDLELTYEDGASVNAVRDRILESCKSIINITISRVYSRAAVSGALQALYDTDDDLAVRVESLLFSEDLACPVKEQRYRN